MADVLARDPTGLQLQGDPAALAPERLLVFVVRGLIQNFVNAIRRVPGLELIDEEELAGDDQDKAPVMYLLIPDATALQQVVSLWNQWRANRDLGAGFTPWRDVFALLRDLRPWGPDDRVTAYESAIIEEDIEGRDDDELVSLEVELVFRETPKRAAAAEDTVRRAIDSAGGKVVARSRIEDIAYHALLTELPVRAIRAIAARSHDSLASVDEVMHIRPQSTPPALEALEVEASAGPVGRAPVRAPILALIDGVPIAEHPILAGRLVVDDQFGLEPVTSVQDRYHGTAMSSVIVHGDRNLASLALPRLIHVVPVMTSNGGREAFPSNQLVIDIIYRAVMRMRDGHDATARDVIIVNVSLGNVRRPFQGQMSAWARLLDRLAWRFGILFIVSAGNIDDPFRIPAFRTNSEFEDAQPAERAVATLEALSRLMPQRRIISPAETVNGVTVGAVNHDAVPAAHRRAAALNVNPYSATRMTNPSSGLGPGFAGSIKPDILMPGAREHLRTRAGGAPISVAPANPSRAFGIKAAVPPRGDDLATEGYTGKTSAAAALASRTCHQIHDALETSYGDSWTGLTDIGKAVMLKALLVHPASWPADAARLISDVIGPADPKQHVRRKDNVRRFLGYGTFEPQDAVACAADRATFWATGSLAPEQSVAVSVPIPVCISGQARVHSMTATVAWFTPVQPARRTYRGVRLRLLEPEDLGPLRVGAAKDQPDSNQIRRGTVSSRRWSGDRAPAIVNGMSTQLIVQREPDLGEHIDEDVPFGLAVTLTMPGIVEVYDQVRLRLEPRVRPRGR